MWLNFPEIFISMTWNNEFWSEIGVMFSVLCCNSNYIMTVASIRRSPVTSVVGVADGKDDVEMWKLADRKDMYIHTSETDDSFFLE